jgi:hypothetical protein
MSPTSLARAPSAPVRATMRRSPGLDVRPPPTPAYTTEQRLSRSHVSRTALDPAPPRVVCSCASRRALPASPADDVARALTCRPDPPPPARWLLQDAWTPPIKGHGRFPTCARPLHLRLRLAPPPSHHDRLHGELSVSSHHRPCEHTTTTVNAYRNSQSR